MTKYFKIPRKNRNLLLQFRNSLDQFNLGGLSSCVVGGKSAFTISGRFKGKYPFKNPHVAIKIDVYSDWIKQSLVHNILIDQLDV